MSSELKEFSAEEDALICRLYGEGRKPKQITSELWRAGHIRRNHATVYRHMHELELFDDDPSQNNKDDRAERVDKRWDKALARERPNMIRGCSPADAATLTEGPPTHSQEERGEGEQPRDDYDATADAWGSVAEAYRLIRGRMAGGGPGWEPK